MFRFACPRCQEDTISFRDKYLAGVWRVISCPQCAARLTAYPILLLMIHMAYVWNILWFFGLYYFERDFIYFAYMAMGWIILDFLNVQLIPLALLKNKTL